MLIMFTEDPPYLITSPLTLARMSDEIISSSIQTPIRSVEIHLLAPLRTEPVLKLDGALTGALYG
jgi:hypothetical protein